MKVHQSPLEKPLGNNTTQHIHVALLSSTSGWSIGITWEQSCWTWYRIPDLWAIKMWGSCSLMEKCVSDYYSCNWWLSNIILFWTTVDIQNCRFLYRGIWNNLSMTCFCGPFQTGLGIYAQIKTTARSLH